MDLSQQLSKLHPSLLQGSNPLNILRQLEAVARARIEPVIELQCGETRGPFVVRELSSEASEGENQITLLDQLGQPVHFEVESRDPIVRRIRPIADARLANCVIFHLENIMRLVVTKDIRRGEDLLAAFLPQTPPTTNSVEEKEKKYLCSMCNSAKFSTRENLVAHQTLYCSKNVPTVVPAPQTASLPNVLLLPLAFHEQPQTDLVQLLGPPQTIVPVAVGRNSLPSMNPLIIERSLCAAVNAPGSMQFNVNGLPVTIPIVCVDPVPAMATTSTAGQKRPIERVASPLDLSKRVRMNSTGPSTSNGIKQAPSEVEKPFTCSCGVAFSAENTLKAHQLYYCKDVDRGEEQREPTRKVPSRCSYCDFEPQSQSQLSIHIRNVHNDVQAYVCNVCGYRGFSLRGIRSHMRSHPSLDTLKFDTLFATHITQVKSEQRTPPRDREEEEEEV